jgi:integrase
MYTQPYLAQNDRGYWEIRWSEPGGGGSGKTRSRNLSTRTADRAIADSIFGQWLKSRDAVVELFATPTVGECIDKYLLDARRRGVHQSQYWVLDRWRQSPLSGLRPVELSGKPLREWRAQRGLVAAASTVQREVGALLAALNWAAHPDKGGLIAAGEVPRVAMGPVHYPEKRFLDEASEAKFLELALAWRVPRVGRFVAIGLNTGARKEAIEELGWDRIDMKARRIDFRDPKRKVTNKRRVLVPLNERLFPVLDAIPPGDRWGRVIDAADMGASFKKFVETTPWPWVTSHTMRHTFITLALRAGTSLFDVSQLVGDTYATLEAHYAHHQADSALDRAANRRFR